MQISQQILSDITVYMKYARYIPERGRRETWDEIISRNKIMHYEKYKHVPEIRSVIDEAYRCVSDKKVLPSMRSLQFGGDAVIQTPVRMFNCSYIAADDYRVFNETMFLLLAGCGVGFSVQRHHINKLPPVFKPTKRRRYLIADSIEGWADAVKALVKAYLCGKTLPNFDYRDIRPKGSPIKTSGGRAPGPEPLHDCLHNMQKVLDRKTDGERLTTLEVYDLMCYLADAVLAGGIRRSAMIALFDHDDEAMLTSKFGDWWELNPQRARCNNSVVFHRNHVQKCEFDEVWKRVKASGCGEPGIFWTSDDSGDFGANPCVEISLQSCGFCNLTEINASDVTTQSELNYRARMAARIGTLQAGYTDFHYLRPEWQHNAEDEALLGVSMTGIASGTVLDLDLAQAAREMISENKRIAAMIGTKPAKRIGCVKPAGTTSCVLGCSSGIHDWHSRYYIRTIRVDKSDPLYNYLVSELPEFIEDDVLKPKQQAVLSLPQQAPPTAYINTAALPLLERVKDVTQRWILPSHTNGVNHHSVSCTVRIKDDEWDGVRDWMLANRFDYAGLAVLPHDGGSYKQAPFQECDKETYDYLMTRLHKLDLRAVKETQDITDHVDQAACAGGTCELQ